jgi:hypothetical protein
MIFETEITILLQRRRGEHALKVLNINQDTETLIHDLSIFNAKEHDIQKKFFFFHYINAFYLIGLYTSSARALGLFTRPDSSFIDRTLSNEYEKQIKALQNKIEAELKANGLSIVDLRNYHLMAVSDFNMIIHSYTNSQIKRKSRTPHSSPVVFLYDSNKFDESVLHRFIGFANRKIHTADILVASNRDNLIKNMNIKDSPSACKVILCQPAQTYLQQIISDNKLPIDFSHAKLLLIKFEKYAYQHSISIVPRIMISIVLFLMTDLTQEKICKMVNITSVTLRHRLKQFDKTFYHSVFDLPFINQERSFPLKHLLRF